ncbi:hypothetical protein [Pseudomonas synxantha]|uniref:hypothetical protein n=1 Tax=Pseudomonas synxantha TaxID=47883 RepID=UPI000F55AB2E|nr:hypothetical protein [Pseudomonas synxantha]
MEFAASFASLSFNRGEETFGQYMRRAAQTHRDTAAASERSHEVRISALEKELTDIKKTQPEAYAHQIKLYKELASLQQHHVGVNAHETLSLNQVIKEVEYKSQDKGLALSRGFKAEQESLKDQPVALETAHRTYIDALSVTLPEGDDFLRREQEGFEQKYPDAQAI